MIYNLTENRPRWHNQLDFQILSSKNNQNNVRPQTKPTMWNSSLFVKPAQNSSNLEIYMPEYIGNCLTIFVKLAKIGSIFKFFLQRVFEKRFDRIQNYRNLSEKCSTGLSIIPSTFPENSLGRIFFRKKFYPNIFFGL